MSKDNYVLLIRPESMRLFHKGQSHDGFEAVEYLGQTTLELAFEVSGSEILIGQERNPSNRLNFINPLSEVPDQVRSGMLNGLSSLDLMVAAVKKVLTAYHFSLDDSTNFQTKIPRSLLCVMFELGIEQGILKAFEKRISMEPFAGVVCINDNNSYFDALPTDYNPKILIKSVGSDLYYFYESSKKIKQRQLAAVAFNPLIEVVAEEIYNYIVKTNAYLSFNYSEEVDNFIHEAQKIVETNKPVYFGDIKLSNGQNYEYDITLARCKTRAEGGNESALIIREIISICFEIGIEEKDVHVYYSGQNISNDYFDKFFSNNLTGTHRLDDYFTLTLQLTLAEQKLSELITRAKSNDSENINAEINFAESAQVPNGKTNARTSKAPAVAPGALSPSNQPILPPIVHPHSSHAKPSSHTEDATSNKKPIPTPPKVGSAKKPPPPPPPPPLPRKGSSSTHSQVGAASPKILPPKPKKQMAPPPPPPHRGSLVSSGKNVPGSLSKVSASVKRQTPPPPPPPKKK